MNWFPNTVPDTHSLLLCTYRHAEHFSTAESKYTLSLPDTCAERVFHVITRITVQRSSPPNPSSPTPNPSTTPALRTPSDTARLRALRPRAILRYCETARLRYCEHYEHYEHYEHCEAAQVSGRDCGYWRQRALHLRTALLLTHEDNGIQQSRQITTQFTHFRASRLAYRRVIRLVSHSTANSMHGLRPTSQTAVHSRK